jgi:tetratricopeptide (TPR) repeat protein
MFETIREFALERLGSSGERAVMTRRHYDHFLRFAESLNLSAHSVGVHRADLIAPDRDNLRAAMDRAADAGDVEAAVRLALALEEWLTAINPLEGLPRIERFLSSGARLPDALRAGLLRARGGATQMHSGGGDPRPDYESALAIFRAIGDELSSAEMLVRLGTATMYAGNLPRARELTMQALEAAERLGGNRRIEAYAFGVLGQIEWAEGAPDLAIASSLKAAEAAREIGFVWWEGLSLSVAAGFALRLGRLDDAEELTLRALPLGAEIGDGQVTVSGLAVLAWIAAARRDLPRAGILWGAVEVVEQSGWSLGSWAEERDEAAAATVQADDPAFQAGVAEGRQLSIEDAVRIAVGDSSPDAPPMPAGG